MNPFAVLGVPWDADDAQVRRAYLEAVKRATPESNPPRFQGISEAYQKIKEQAQRRQHLFHRDEMPGDSPASTLIHYLQLRPPEAPPAFDQMKEYLRACLTK